LKVSKTISSSLKTCFSAIFTDAEVSSDGHLLNE
jgi:hypothetical protein